MPLIDSEIIRKTLKENLPFSLLGEDRCEDLIPLFSTLTYKLGEIVIRQGEPSDGYFIVMAGKARVIDTERDGLTLAVLQKGDGFGEQSLLTGQPSVATERGHQSWHASHGHRAWPPSVATEGGDRVWPQRVATTRGHNAWPPSVATTWWPPSVATEWPPHRA